MSGEQDPLVVSLVAPHGCGKTTFLAALLRLASQGAFPVGGDLLRVSALTGHGASSVLSEQAMRHLLEVYGGVLAGAASRVTRGCFGYRMLLERLESDRSVRREIVVLDAQGEALFPSPDEELAALRSAHASALPRLRTRLGELGLENAEHMLLVFVNEPIPEAGWRIPPSLPRALEVYLSDVRIDRVALLAACADLVFPRVSDLGAELAGRNAQAMHEEGLQGYLSLFRGSPQRAFAASIVRYIARSIDAGSSAQLGMFWASALGRAADTGVQRASLPHAWQPLHVLDSLVWGSGLLDPLGIAEAGSLTDNAARPPLVR